MSKSLDEKLNELGPRRRKKVEARAAALIAEEMSLRELRRARRLTQKRMAEKLRIGQEGVSRLEQRSDLLISTLRSYVEAMGGSLSIVAQFPDRKPVVLAGLASLEDRPSGQRPRPDRLQNVWPDRAIHHDQLGLKLFLGCFYDETVTMKARRGPAHDSDRTAR